MSKFQLELSNNNRDFTLGTVLDDLQASELSLMADGDKVGRDLTHVNMRRVLTRVNRAMRAIQSDLELFTDSLRLVTGSRMITYPLLAEHSILSGDSLSKALFIMDTPEYPFLNEVHKVKSVRGEDGLAFRLNDVGPDPMDGTRVCYLPSHNVLQFDPDTMIDGEVITVGYNKVTTPVEITATTDPYTIPMPIPQYTSEALYAYVSALSMIGLEADQSVALDLAQYNAEIDKVRHDAPVPHVDFGSSVFDNRGFV